MRDRHARDVGQEHDAHQGGLGTRQPRINNEGKEHTCSHSVHIIAYLSQHIVSKQRWSGDTIVAQTHINRTVAMASRNVS